MFSGVLSEGCLPGGFIFCDRRRFSAVSHPQQYSIATRDTVIPMNIEVPTKYWMSHNAKIVVLEIRFHGESPILYRPALHGNWSALSLARRALKDKFPTPKIPLTALLPSSSVISAEPCTIFFHIVSSTTRYSKKRDRFNIKCVFRISLPLAYETFLTLRRIQHIYWSSCSACQILMELEFSPIYFRKITKCKLLWKPI